ncbi:hypothetical protein FAZ95_13790 [Trinickia violacea]|uniref:Phage tail tape measure protein n=1 Tax=Trinickia violacea TaxID=2571746 RepID=A0A4P8IR52_9BURK|nr:hypothetical protein [Trinickia violacea]QCP50155.1 hypothetical protein FAZ95_13790 [Trinickia violacea]
MSTAFKSKVEITATEGVSEVCNRINARLGEMARVVHDRTKFMMNDMAATVGEKMQMIANHTKGLWGSSGILGALGGALATGGAVESLNELSEKVEHLRMQGASIGMPVAEMQRWSYAAEQAGVDADVLTRGLAKMGETAFDVARGKAKDQAELFKQMGVAVKDAKGNVRGITDVAMDVASRFKEHMDRINKLRDQGNASLAGRLESESNNAAQKMFGMKAREVAALMAEGKEGIRKAFAEADSTGGVFSDEQVEKVEKYAKSLKKLEFAKQGLLVNLFADKMEWLANKASGLASKIGAFEKAHPALFKIASGAIAAAGGLIVLATTARLAQMGFTFLAGGQLVTEIREVGLAAAMSARMVGLMGGAARAAGGALRAITSMNPWLLALSAAAALIYYNWDKIQPVVEKVWSNLVGVWDAVEPLVEAFGSGVWEIFRSALGEIGDTLSLVWTSLSEVGKSFDSVDTAVGDAGAKFEIAAGFANAFSVALAAVQVVADLVSGTIRAIAASIDIISGKIKSVQAAADKGGFMAGVASLFNANGEDQKIIDAATKKANLVGFGDKLTGHLKALNDSTINPVTAGEMRDRAQENARLLGRAPARTISERPQEVKMAGPVEVNTKGKLGIDLRISADQGLKVSQSGVDKSGAPNIVGNVGVSTVTP